MAHAFAPLVALCRPSTRQRPCNFVDSRHRRAGSRAVATFPRLRASSSAPSSPSSSSPDVHFEDVILGSSRTTDMAHTLWRAVLRPGDTAIDATMGNGWDTLILAELVFGDGDRGAEDGDGDVSGKKGEGEGVPTLLFGGMRASPRGRVVGEDRGEARLGRVVAFDIQQGALDSTRAKVEARLTPDQAARVHLVLGSHATLDQHVDVGEKGNRREEGNSGFGGSSVGDSGGGVEGDSSSGGLPLDSAPQLSALQPISGSGGNGGGRSMDSGRQLSASQPTSGSGGSDEGNGGSGSGTFSLDRGRQLSTSEPVSSGGGGDHVGVVCFNLGESVCK